MLVRVENSKAKYKQQKELCAELEYRVIEDEKHYERKLNASYNDKEVHDLQRTVLEMEQEAEALDEQNAQMEAELERYQNQLAARGVNDLSELGGTLHHINE